MSSQPAVHAETAAEAIRSLNHASLPWSDGLTYPSDVYDTVGHLAALAARLPQALSQLQAFLDTETDAGRVAIVDGEHAGDPAAAAAVCGHWTETAATAAEQLRHALEQAHTVLASAASTSCPSD